MKNIVLQKTILETGGFGGGWGFTELETVTMYSMYHYPLYWEGKCFEYPAFT
jgi:hypothetical protein